MAATDLSLQTDCRGPHLITQETPLTTPHICIIVVMLTEVIARTLHVEHTRAPGRSDDSSCTVDSAVVTCSSGTGQIRDGNERWEVDTGRLVCITLRTVGHAPEMSRRQPETIVLRRWIDSGSPPHTQKKYTKPNDRNQTRHIKINKRDRADDAVCSAHCAAS